MATNLLGIFRIYICFEGKTQKKRKMVHTTAYEKRGEGKRAVRQDVCGQGGDARASKREQAVIKPSHISLSRTSRAIGGQDMVLRVQYRGQVVPDPLTMLKAAASGLSLPLVQLMCHHIEESGPNLHEITPGFLERTTPTLTLNQYLEEESSRDCLFTWVMVTLDKRK